MKLNSPRQNHLQVFDGWVKLESGFVAIKPHGEGANTVGEATNTPSMTNPFKQGDKVLTLRKGIEIEATVRTTWNHEVQVRTADGDLLWRTMKTIRSLPALETDQPADAPVTVEPATVEPGEVEPITVEPAMAEPSPVEPGTVTPDTLEPGTVEPVPVEPGTVEPGTVEPDPVEPDPVEPATVEPVMAEPLPLEPDPVKPAKGAPKAKKRGKGIIRRFICDGDFDA